MLKRLRWMATGLAVGVGGSIWAQRKVRTMATRYRLLRRSGPQPAGMLQGAASRAADAWREGRVAMRQREAELKSSPDGARAHRP